MAKKTPDTNIRYFIEHKLLPGILFEEDGPQLINTMLQKPGQFFAIVYASLRDGSGCPYDIEEFSAKGFKLDDNTFFVRAAMPEPETEVLCSEIVIVHDKNGVVNRYITVEGSTKKGAFLCEWEESGRHLNYGPYSEEKLLSIIKAK